MCGLAGGTLYSADTIAEAMRLLGHRGRDAQIIRRYGDDVWLGHNRLAIQDLSEAGNQPFECDGYSVVFNGELWRRCLEGYDYLRPTCGYATASDTEILALMYREFGDDLVDFASRLDGMFAFAIHDRRRGRIVLGRDRMGRVPLYAVRGMGSVAFASEAKALARPLGARFDGNGPLRQRRSQVRLFPPGTVATYSLRDGAWRERRFAGLRPPIPGTAAEIDADDRGLEYYADGIRERLSDAVVNELVADVPVCTILSGGVDSTIVTAILAQHVPNLRAYTVSVGPSNGRDDLHYARLAAEAIGVPLTEVVVDREAVTARIEDAVWAVEEDRWVQVAPAVPQIMMARRIGADGYRVVFGGEGADELFGSYGDTRRWYWEPEKYHARRVALCERLHDNNLIRGNKAMMWGGTVELRTPFLDREVVDWCLRIPTRYRSDRDGKGPVLKHALREAFRGIIPDELLMRKKETFQAGAHSDYLEGYKDVMGLMFRAAFAGG